jgi:spore germination protein GerM
MTTEKEVQQALPTAKEIMTLACQTELVYGPTCTGTYFTNIPEGIDITPALVDFAIELLNTYGSTK